MKRYFSLLTLTGILLMVAMILGVSSADAATTELFFSEYIEGSGNNKALEIYNGTGLAVDLAAGSYDIQMYFNGNTSASLTLALTGSVAGGDVYVVANSAADLADLLAEVDQSSGGGWFNGDDVVVLRKNGVIIDSFGQIGTDPGSQWPGGGQDDTLRRMATVCQGDTNATDSFDASSEWDIFPQNNVVDLGSHTADCNGGGTPLSGSGNADPAAVSAGDSTLLTVAVTPADNPPSTGITVVADLTTIGGSASQALVDDGTNGDAAAGDNIFSYMAVVDAGTPAGAISLDVSIADLEGGSASATIQLNVIQIALIHEVQGSGASSPLVGNTVIIEGIVVGDFQDDVGANGDLNGFFVQEEDADADGDALTSEGVFVFQGSNPAVDVAIGDHVRVEGSVSEFFGDTQITSFSGVSVNSSGNPLPTPSVVTLPVSDINDFEAYEGMYATFPQALVISEYFNFDRFGEIVLTSDRQFQPTATYEPGSVDAANLALVNSLARITLDDGRTSQNPDPAIHPNGLEFDLTNLFRGGDTVTDVTGVINYAFGLYRIQPTQGADYTAVNARTASPDPVGGNVSVASFNVLNYFTTLDNGSCPYSGGCRGADDAGEFTRQRDKIIAALKAIDADVVGLIEIENHPGDVPTADLVSGLNDVMGAETYDYVATGAIGSDAIRVAFIYKPASVSPVGDYAVLDTSVDPRFLDGFNRPVLAQTFQDNVNGGVFTAAVNHLKSKGSDCNAIGDPDTGDGAGNCNLTRKAAAEALVDWLAGDPTGSGDSDFLIIGDLNSYDKEDPIDVILQGSDDTLGTGDDYSDLLFEKIGEDAYSYVFDGQIGYLDHALANANLVDEVTSVTVWHINADEADLIDYDTSFKGTNQDDIYAPDAYRSSDHDPVIIGLDVCDEIAPTFDEISVSPDTLWPANHKYVDVTATVIVSDNFDPNPALTLVSVTSNEPDNGLGDGDTPNDIVIVDDFNFQLRAERSGNGDGRIYTITYEVTDACGNSTIATAEVTVPKDKGKRGG